ncbi:MAG: restriction endonuclease [Bacteroides sp.]|nr:restriction endonuclease [Bacteroides sp.]MCM1390481.1 restriction endonuclease [Bacteroides sp.]
MKKTLTINAMQEEALEFCKNNSGIYRSELFGITDGKAVGTIVEHLFKEYLSERYELEIGNSANGLDLPSVNTDIKVTSIKQPQSSCPFKDSKQKIFGLGYNLLVFVYEKHDNAKLKKGMLNFVSCSFIDKSRTGDYQTTTGLLNIIKNNGNQDDIFAFLTERHIPADETTIYNLAGEILKNPPAIGYLTISNALQWRLQYGRIVALADKITGITPIIKFIQ